MYKKILSLFQIQIIPSILKTTMLIKLIFSLSLLSSLFLKKTYGDSNDLLLLDKITKGPQEIDNRGNCKSMKIKYTELGIICKGQKFGNEMILNSLLTEYYELSVCRNKGPTKKTIKRLLEINRNLYKFRWEQINMPELLYSFTYQLEKSKKFYISPICIPQLLGMADIAIWVRFFVKKIRSMISNKKEKDKLWYTPFTRLDMNESETMHKLLPRLTYDLGQRAFEGTPAKRMELINVFDETFKNFFLTTTISKYLRQDQFLLYASWMGSSKALKKSKDIINQYFKKLKRRNENNFISFLEKLRKKRSDNILTAINALKEFNPKDKAELKKIKLFFDNHLKYNKTPFYIIAAIKK